MSLTLEQRRALRQQYLDTLRESGKHEISKGARELVSKSALPSLADRIVPIRDESGEIIAFGEHIPLDHPNYEKLCGPRPKQETSKSGNGLGDGVNDENACFDAAFPFVQSSGVEEQRQRVSKSVDDEDELVSCFPACLRPS